MMTSTDRLKTYTALAVAPCAALGGIAAVGAVSVEATAGGGFPTTVTANAGQIFTNTAVFNAGGIDFNVFAFWSSNNSASMGLSINDRDDAGQIQFWSGGTQSKVISSGATGAGETNNGYGGSQMGNFNLLGTGDTGSNRYLGFFVQHTPSSNYVAGWINFDFNRSSGQRSFTINSYSVDVAGSGATITMPGTAASGAVPGVGGLAGLAMGAVGLRRKRQRVA